MHRFPALTIGARLPLKKIPAARNNSAFLILRQLQRFNYAAAVTAPQQEQFSTSGNTQYYSSSDTNISSSSSSSGNNNNNNNSSSGDQQQQHERKKRKTYIRRMLMLVGVCVVAGAAYMGKSTGEQNETLYDATMLTNPPALQPLVFPTRDPRYPKIIEFMEERMFHKAATVAEELLVADPTDYLARYLKGKALCSMSKFEEAQNELDQVVNIIRPKRDKINGFHTLYMDVLHTLELALFARQKYPEALAVNHYLVAEYPWNLEYVSERADLYANTMQYKDAVRWSEKLLHLHKEQPEIFERNLKASYPQSNLSVDLFLSEVYRIKGFSLYKQHDLENALPCFDVAIKLSPNKDLFYASKAEILQQLERFEEAYNTFTAAPGADTVLYFVFLRLEVLAQQRKFDEALALHEKLLKRDESTPVAALIDILMTKAKLQIGAKRFDDVLETAEQMKEFYTTESLRLKAMAYGGKGNFEEAKNYIDKAIATQPTDHKLYQIRDSIVNELNKEQNKN